MNEKNPLNEKEPQSLVPDTAGRLDELATSGPELERRLRQSPKRDGQSAFSQPDMTVEDS